VEERDAAPKIPRTSRPLVETDTPSTPSAVSLDIACVIECVLALGTVALERHERPAGAAPAGARSRADVGQEVPDADERAQAPRHPDDLLCRRPAHLGSGPPATH
jgi:hypothetical protein